MVRRRWPFVLTLLLGILVFFPARGWSQESISSRTLEEHFYALLLPSLIICLLSGVATAFGLRLLLRHRERRPFPSRLRNAALSSLAVWTVLFVAFYLIAAWVKGIPPLAVVVYTPYNWIAPLGFALLWYVTAYTVFRIGRWSGIYAMWPTRLLGGR
jgi:hypothetical protein